MIDLKLLGYQIKNDLICNFVRWQQNQLWNFDELLKMIAH